MAGLGRKVFTAGDVLTASDVQNYLMDQTVMNFAGTAARSSAIATPTEGMVSYRDDIDNLELYNGSAWVAASGLQLIKKETIGSAVSSVVVTGAFSATYENYRIVISGGAVTGAGGILTLALGASVTGYYNTLVYGNTWATPTATGASTNNGAAWNYAGFADANQMHFNCDISSPFLTKYSFMTGSYISDANAGAVQGVHKVATSYTGFTVAIAGGTMTGGTIYVYGYGK
jgi:hypothetical protein